MFQVHNKVIQIHIYLSLSDYFPYRLLQDTGTTEYSSSRSLLLICSMHAVAAAAARSLQSCPTLCVMVSIRNPKFQIYHSHPFSLF